MKDEWTIYKIVFPNGKHYIGLTKDMYGRISAHKRDSTNKVRRPVYHAINHFGWDNIKFEEIETEIPTLEEANKLEMKYIVKYSSHVDTGNGYNCTKGGDGSLGTSKTPEEIEAFRKRSIELWKTEEHRSRMAEVSARRKEDYTPEVRKKMSESAKKRIARDGHSWTGRNHNEESKAKMRGPRNKNLMGYKLKSIKDGKRIYCSKLDFVFFSIKECAEFFGVRNTTIWSGIKNPNTRKYKSLSYYD